MLMKRRVVSCLLAHTLCAVGVALTVKSGIGVSPVAMLPYTLSLILGVELGFVQFVYFCVLALSQIAILGRAYQPARLFQLPVAVLISGVVTVTGRLLAFTPNSYPVVLGLQLLGIVMCATGVFLNVDAGVVLNSPEGFVQALDERLPWKFSSIKVTTDCAFVALSVVLGLMFLGIPAGLREGTLLNALLCGRIIGLWQAVCGKRLHSYHYGEAAEKAATPDGFQEDQEKSPEPPVPEAAQPEKIS